MPNPFSFRALLKKREDGLSNKGKDQETVTSISRLGVREGSDNREREISPSITGVTLHEELTPDKYGLILLNGDSGQQLPNYTVDVIAVHGLGGGAYKTWTHENGKLWLRDFLPGDLPGARVFTYGYDSTFVFSRKTGTLRAYARALIEDIRCERTLAEVYND